MHLRQQIHLWSSPSWKNFHRKKEQLQKSQTFPPLIEVECSIQIILQIKKITDLKSQLFSTSHAIPSSQARAASKEVMK